MSVQLQVQVIHCVDRYIYTMDDYNDGLRSNHETPEA